jgi:hypothetical protein
MKLSFYAFQEVGRRIWRHIFVRVKVQFKKGSHDYG